MKKQFGFTLIEIMISLLLGLIVLGATISVYVTTVGSSTDIIKTTRLNHDLDSIMTLMINDIKRAGYWGGATMMVDSRTNLFTSTTGTTTDLQIPDNTGNSCILYSYDADGDGVVTYPSANSNELYGFKLEDNTIKMRKTGTNTTDCSNGTWEEFIDGDLLTITNLQFSFTPMTGLTATSRCLNVTTSVSTNTVSTACTGAATGDNLAEKRIVNIQLTGRLTNDTTVTKTLNGTVAVRNNRLYIQP